MHKVSRSLLLAAVFSFGTLTSACSTRQMEAAPKTEAQYRTEALEAYATLAKPATPNVEIAEKMVSIIDSGYAHVADLKMKIPRSDVATHLANSRFNRAKAEFDTIQYGLLNDRPNLLRLKSAMQHDLNQSGRRVSDLAGEKNIDGLIAMAIARDAINISGGTLVVLSKSDADAKDRAIAIRDRDNANLRKQLSTARTVKAAKTKIDAAAKKPTTSTKSPKKGAKAGPRRNA